MMKRYLARLMLALPFIAMAPAMADSPRIVEVAVSRYAFSPATIEVAVGERVRLNLSSTDGSHGFHVRALGLDAQVPDDGSTVAVDFTPAEAGIFEVQCSAYCGRGHKMMKARLVVRPRP